MLMFIFLSLHELTFTPRSAKYSNKVLAEVERVGGEWLDETFVPWLSAFFEYQEKNKSLPVSYVLKLRKNFEFFIILNRNLWNTNIHINIFKYLDIYTGVHLMSISMLVLNPQTFRQSKEDHGMSWIILVCEIRSQELWDDESIIKLEQNHQNVPTQ